MNALPTPSSSATTGRSARRLTKSPMTVALFSAAEARDSARAMGSYVCALGVAVLVSEGISDLGGLDVVSWARAGQAGANRTSLSPVARLLRRPACQRWLR